MIQACLDFSPEVELFGFSVELSQTFQLIELFVVHPNSFIPPCIPIHVHMGFLQSILQRQGSQCEIYQSKHRYGTSHNDFISQWHKILYLVCFFEKICILIVSVKQLDFDFGLLLISLWVHSTCELAYYRSHVWLLVNMIAIMLLYEGWLADAKGEQIPQCSTSTSGRWKFEPWL